MKRRYPDLYKLTSGGISGPVLEQETDWRRIEQMMIEVSSGRNHTLYYIDQKRLQRVFKNGAKLRRLVLDLFKKKDFPPFYLSS